MEKKKGFGISSEPEPIKDYEYLIHHIETAGGKEEIHHCMLYDHIANMFTQEHLVVENGVATMNGKKVADGTFHVITGLEPTQEVCWSDDMATEEGVSMKRMVPGMTLKQKSKEW